MYKIWIKPSFKILYKYHTQKKDLIESKKMICLNDFLWFKEMICLNEIKFLWFKLIFLQNKEINALIYIVKDIICLI